MYTDFFELKRNPFELSPDPSFLFPSEQSKEALAAIRYAISQRKGFIVMTGEVGTGKTLILRSLFRSLKHEHIAFANIFAPRLSVVDFLTHATADLGIVVNEPGKGNLLRALYDFVVAQFQKGLTTVLAIDEAHQIPSNMLEEIRMLTNLETDEQKLVQVLLVGQPELDKKLDSFELRQLKQRIALRCHLEPLREEETRHYIECRLRLAGASAEAETIFPPETTKAIYYYSQGIPRLINSVSERALMIACARQSHVVPVEIINEVASYFRLAPSSDLTASAAKASAPDTFATEAKARRGMSAEVRPQRKPRISYEDSLRKILGVGQEGSTELPVPNAAEKQLSGHESTEFGGLDPTSPNGEARAIELPSERSDLSVAPTSVTALAETGPSQSIEHLPPPTTESIPSPSDHTLHDTRLDGLRRRLEPAVQLSYKQDDVQGWIRQRPAAWKKALLISAGAIVVVGLAALATGNLVARRQNQAVTVLHHAASASDTFQGSQTVASVQFAGGTSPIGLNASSAAPIPPWSDIEIGKSAATPEHPTDRKKSSIGTLSRPVLTSPTLSAVTEPPLVMGTQAIDVPLNSGLLASPGPTAPGASSGGHLQPPKLVASTQPVYPPFARSARLEGAAVINALVDTMGTVTDMAVISGPSALTQAAMVALRTWKYEPAQLNGQPIAMHIQVRINFSLQ